MPCAQRGPPQLDRGAIASAAAEDAAQCDVIALATEFGQPVLSKPESFIMAPPQLWS
jgi:hypothetical protein